MANLYYKGKLISGIAKIPRLTLSDYNSLTVKPEVWIRTDAPESYKKITASDVSFTSGGGLSSTDVQAALAELDNEKFDKTGGYVNGNIAIDNASPTTSNLDSVLSLGNTIPEGTVGNSAGIIHFYARNGHQVQLYPTGAQPADVAITFPYESGRLALDKYGTASPSVSYSNAGEAYFDINLDVDSIYLLTISVNGGGGSRFLTPDMYLIYVEDRNSHIVGGVKICNKLGDNDPTITYQSDTGLYRITKYNNQRRSTLIRLTTGKGDNPY